MNQGKVIHYSQVEAEVAGDGAAGASIRWLIDEEHDGARIFVMRMIELEPGGYTPYHHHPGEHEVFIWRGEGKLRLADKTYPLTPGTAVFVPPQTEHQFVNTSDSEKLEFICVVPLAKK